MASGYSGMAAARSLQQLCRAASSLCNAASTSPVSSSALAAGASQLGAGSLRAAAAAASGASLQQQAAAAAGLRQLVRHFHASLGLRQADAGASPGMNPLQQAPVPASPPPRAPLAPGLDFGGSAADNEGAALSRAVQRGIPISPQKLNDFAKVVRGLHLEDAMIQCAISPKKAAKIVEKALLSAQANAVTNQGLDASRLRVAEAWVGNGQHLKRTSVHGRGRSGRRLRYRSHLTVVLREEDVEPRRRTRTIPQLMERQKVWRMREAQQAAAQPQ